METTQSNIMSFIKEATGKTDIFSIDFKNLDNATKNRIDFKKVRGSVRLMSGRIKTMVDVDAMRKAFLALRLP
jgi:hypothetical protein